MQVFAYQQPRRFCKCAARDFNLKSYTRTCLARLWFWYGLLAESSFQGQVESNGSVAHTFANSDEFITWAYKSIFIGSTQKSRPRTLRGPWHPRAQG
jgi:hypothetical protein